MLMTVVNTEAIMLYFLLKKHFYDNFNLNNHINDIIKSNLVINIT